VVDHPGQVILMVLLVTLIFAWHLPKLRFETSIYDLSIENLPETLEYGDFKKEFGSEEIILVVASADNVFDPGTFEELDRLATRLSQVKGVQRVISLPGIKKAMDITDKWRLPDFQKIIGPIKLLERNLVSADGKTTVITLVLEDVKEKDPLIQGVAEILQSREAGLPLYQIGMPIVSKALAQYTEQDFLRLPPITFGLIAVILFLFLRNLRGILIPAGSVFIALIWTFGLMGWTGTPLAMLTMIVPIFLIAVGTAYCMYIFPEYREAVAQNDSPREAALACFLRLGFPTSLAVATTSIGLCSLLVNRINAIREFALFSCFGILSMLFILLTLLPAVLALLPLPGKKQAEKAGRQSLVDRILGKIVRINTRHQKLALCVIGFVALVGLLGISRLRVETNPVGFFRSGTPVARHFHHIYQDMAGSFPLNVVIDAREDDFFENPDHLKRIESLQAHLDTLDGVDKTLSFVDYLKLVNYASNQYKPEFYALPEEGFELRMLVNSYKTMLGQDMFERFMNGTFSKVNILLRTHLSSSVDFLAAQKRIEQDLRNRFPATFGFQVTGFGIVISQSSRLLTEGQVKSLSITLILVFTIMLLLFMSYKVGLIAMVPNLFPIVVTFGLMGWLGIPLSVATSLIASVAIGLAVDDTIHYLARYNREFKGDLDKTRALRDTILNVGKPIIFTTLTISIGFSILMFSSFKPTATFGLMMIITMFSALVADLILLPSLMLHVELVTVWDLLRLKLGKDPQKGIPLFDGLSRTQVHYILMAGALNNYEPGSVIMRKGEVSDSMYAVISGELEVVQILGDASEDISDTTKMLISTLKPGDVVGEMGMIRSCERSATVIATQPSELLQINDRMVGRLHWLYPPTAQKFFFNLMAIVCNRLESLTECYLESSITDTLSGLHTRDFFTGMLEKETARSRRYQTPLSLFFMDMDDFKGVNQVHGHQSGDMILAETGRLLSERMRKIDLPCRYDGQRFAVLLPHIDREMGRQVCERFRDLLAKHCFEVNAKAIYVTASFGLTSFTGDGAQTPAEILKSALEALERAKAAGGNCVHEHAA
jgi:diguanylate cyclase (GGDEF)-like protein